LNIGEKGKIRERVYDLMSLMKRLKVTSVLADESMESEGGSDFCEGDWTKTDIIRFLSDSVSIFYMTGLAGNSDRAIKIEKMRRTNHVRDLVGMRITTNGVEVLSTNHPATNPVLK